MSVRLDWLLIGLFVGLAVCLNSCSAVSTLKGYSALCLPFAIAGCVLLLLLPDAEKSTPALQVGVLVFTIPVVLSAIGNLDYSNVANSLSLLAVVVLAYLSVRKVGALRICRLFVRLICATAGVALVLWALTVLLGANLPLPVFENINGIHYKTIFIASQYADTFADVSKSMGFFWEGGIFASYLLLAVAVEFMVEEKPSKTRLVLLIVTLFTTGSTAGCLLLPLALAVGLLKRGGRGRLAIASLIVLLVVGVFANYSSIVDALMKVDSSLFWKLGDAQAVTKLTRLQSPEVCWNLFVANPILGMGYGDALESYSVAIAGSSSIDSLTTTSFFQLAAFGVAGFTMWAMTIYALVGNRCLPVSGSLVLALLFVLILNKEPHTASTLTYILLFSFLAFSGDGHAQGFAPRIGGACEE